MSERKVLIIDDCQIHHIIYEKELKNHTFVLSAFTCNQAKELFFTHHFNLDIIAVDAHPLNFLIVVTFVVEIRKTHGYKRPMIAISNDQDCQNGLREAGCDYECTKDLLGEKVIKLLNTHLQSVGTI